MLLLDTVDVTSFSAKKKLAIESWKDIEELKCIYVVKKTILKDYILYGSNYMTFLNRQNYGTVKKAVAARE